jgi:acyl-CoA thioesterase-2
MEPMPFAADMNEMLAVEAIDRDIFRGWNTVDAKVKPALYGGQVAAQALMAAGRTVDADRPPHSLHGYFLRPGNPKRPVLLQVNRDRDGRSFSARHVSAVQDGEVIFSMLASFHLPEASPTVDLVPTNPALDPEACSPRGDFALLDIRAPVPDDPETNRGTPPYMWMRSRMAVPADPLIQACALTYVSDLGSGFGQVEVSGLAKGGPSIDHALWFHAPVDVNHWLLLELWPSKAGGARGVYAGSLRDQHGLLGATLVQEMLLRTAG